MSVQGFRDEFQSSEIIRILLQTPVAIRFIGQRHADERQGEKEALEKDVVLLFKNIAKPEREPLPLREACNKVIHVKNVVPDSNGSHNPYTHFLKPRVFCYEDFRQKRGWKAEIHMLRFVEACDALAQLFA